MSSHLILAVNAGSSSLKLSLFILLVNRKDLKPKQEPVSLLATSSVSDIGTSNSKFSYSLATSPLPKRLDLPTSISDHAAAFEHFLRALFSDQEFLKSGYGRHEITHICHRIVHGGQFADSVIVEKSTYERLQALSDLAPLHNNRALSVIKACRDLLPNAQSIAFFDSTFHRTLLPDVYTYPISPAVANEKNLRKYGFHGFSYSFILRSVGEYLKKPTSEVCLIALHLGSGASVCAIRGGKSVNTSMGLTPLSGLPGATRSGDIDPSLIFHYTLAAGAQGVGRMSHERTRNMHITEAEKILNTEAGWKALTGTTDFHEIATSRKESHRLAFDILVDRVCQFVGGYFVQLEGRLDAVVFSGGLGENSPELRRAVIQRCACLGMDHISETMNMKVGQGEGGQGEDVIFDIGQGVRQPRTLVCKTNEELEIARQCVSKDEYWTSKDPKA
ncbi:acetate kinase [Gautieria morchelliformis]|nr:acetate kinase [Gautieria morchelliformis]